MSETLFDLPEQPSPRLAWLRKHGVKTKRYLNVTAGDTDADGNRMFAWCAWTDSESPPCDEYERGDGDTEQEALCNLAIKRHWRLWNEENA